MCEKIKRWFCSKKDACHYWNILAKPTPTFDSKDQLFIDNYISRIRTFQNQLITWGITWNIALIGASFLGKNNSLPLNISPSLTALGTVFLLNCMMAILYSNGRLTTNYLVREYRLPTGGPKLKFKNIKVLFISWIVLQLSITFCYYIFYNNGNKIIPYWNLLLDCLSRNFVWIMLIIGIVLTFVLNGRHKNS